MVAAGHVPTVSRPSSVLPLTVESRPWSPAVDAAHTLATCGGGGGA